MSSNENVSRGSPDGRSESQSPHNSSNGSVSETHGEISDHSGASQATIDSNVAGLSQYSTPSPHADSSMEIEGKKQNTQLSPRRRKRLKTNVLSFVSFVDQAAQRPTEDSASFAEFNLGTSLTNLEDSVDKMAELIGHMRGGQLADGRDLVKELSILAGNMVINVAPFTGGREIVDASFEMQQ